MKLKQAILTVMDRDTFKAVVEALEIDDVDRRIVEDMQARVSRSHRATPEVLLEYLNEWQVKAVCEQMGIDSKGRRKELVEGVAMRFDPSLKRFLRENIWHPSQEFSKDKDGSVLLTMGVGGLSEVMSWVLGFGRQAEALEPAHLRKAVAEEIEAAAGRYHVPYGDNTVERPERIRT
jgi:predicted DNA-binding transcriptional regulator YafY